MRIKTARYKGNRRANVLSLLAAIIITVVGFLISLPFTWLVVIKGNAYHNMDFLGLLMIVGFVLGGILFMFGLVNILIGNRPVGSSSTLEMDIGRIRYKVENDKTK